MAILSVDPPISGIGASFQSRRAADGAVHPLASLGRSAIDLSLLRRWDALSGRVYGPRAV
jgi:hypothetical protein